MEIHKRKCFLQEKVAAWSERIKDKAGEHKAESFGFGNSGEIQYLWNCAEGVKARSKWFSI